MRLVELLGEALHPALRVAPPTLSRDQLKAGDLALLQDIAQEGTNVRFLVISAPQPDSWLKATTRLNADVVDHIDVAVAVPGGAR